MHTCDPQEQIDKCLACEREDCASYSCPEVGGMNKNKAERIKRELDAAGEDMKLIADNSMCECCVHNNSEDEEQFCDKNTIVYGCNQFEWRGLKEA